MRIHKNGKDICSVEDWFQFSPPKEGLRQWKDGRSAKELAKAWFPQTGSPQLPADLNSLLQSHPDLTSTEILEGTPEHKISLDNFRGETRNADLVLVGKRGNSLISINIEAKADEPYDQTLAKKLKSVKNPRSKIPDRINLLCQALFGAIPESDPELLNLRYQLLTGCAGAMIEASRIGAKVAVFVVHVFLSDAVDEEKVRLNDIDYVNFLEYMECADAENINDGSLIGPLMVPGGPFVSPEMPLYVGKIKTRVTGLP
jgi:hypothetical protein